ncbi:bifunctional diguanylate cyclase/phosphodiesterase [Planomicrobium sp. YIM 101495]|uniref:bifunctional diguanylate cyclase/phosphodiesterase n=1 Tax=Planomicrobium sp. YIM 101495 TaxID=2665160 RepID=UPI0012B709F5|nr:bifunctional diguanylate cyclase/phosphodiesterase [Planomicrobium sp. YIM 101495]MTD30929.1 EAL domain-containing protein [Planomicrobium sp. YIM 101495]
MSGLVKHLSDHLIFHQTPFPILALDEHGVVVWCNEQANRYLTRRTESLIDSIYGGFNPEQLKASDYSWEAIFANDKLHRFEEMEIDLKDGIRLPVTVVAKSFEFEGTRYALCIFEIDSNGEPEAASIELEQLRSGLDATFMLSYYDENFTITYANSLFLSRSQWTPKRVLGKAFHQMFGSTSADVDQVNRIVNVLKEGTVWSGDIEKSTKNGESYWVELVAIPMQLPGNEKYYICIEKDVTDRKEAQRSLEEIAFIDPATGLANRHSLEQSVKETIASGQHFSFVYIDIDRFYTLRDVSNSETEQKLLQELTVRLKTYFPDTVITRAGLHEFALITPLSSWFIEGFSDYLKQHPIYIEGSAIPLTVSGAITRFPEDQQTFTHLMKASVATIKQIRERGGNAISGLSAEAHEELNRKTLIEERLTGALERNDLNVLYQPIVNLKSGDLERVEALVRWEDEVAGSIMPAELIPIAEETGLIHEIGQFVLKTVCKQLADWNSRGLDIDISINTSIREFRGKNMVDLLMQQCKAAGCNPSSLTIEINEKFAFEAEAEQDIVHQMKLLQQQGVRFALDDFGTGYASFRYLLLLPITSIKIDASIIQPLAHQEKMQKMVNGLIHFGKSLDFQVTAEGVETDEQLQLLTAMDCNTIQGFLSGRPMKAADLENWIQ